MVLAYPKNHYQKILRFFLLRGGLPNPKGFYQKKTDFFWHNLPKKGGFIKKTGIFLTIFRLKGTLCPEAKCAGN